MVSIVEYVLQLEKMHNLENKEFVAFLWDKRIISNWFVSLAEWKKRFPLTKNTSQKAAGGSLFDQIILHQWENQTR